MKIIATDLDRTLFPNGNHRLSKGAMDFFKENIKKNNIKLIYVTGRYESLIKDGIKRYESPLPDFCIALLGTVIYDLRNGKFKRYKKWDQYLEKDWNEYKRKDIASLLKDIKNIKEQEKIKLNDYKQSYYFDTNDDIEKTINKIKTKLKNKKINAEIIHSVDVNRNIGLLDIVPKTGTKLAALNYLIKQKYKTSKKDVLYSGDSGNDILPLASGMYGVLVKNASDRTKSGLKNIIKEKKLKKIHIAQGNFMGLNGNYVSGIIEGAFKFNFFKK